ncbi:dioxygenase [Salipaludibacillus aurantiacus]|uniref:Catechol 1,2-dioxygenase n=1 Tax=Salipaludibacillus aurantiacus TaxID=1601833 RepID=A0A1H9VZQ2_9BACI|nr:dioxygenase [Salipaludibacillus aurantiacus]SES27155.1 catechol 1,2-dioxygenase [Salipaludibacillus aurantiacus]
MQQQQVTKKNERVEEVFNLFITHIQRFLEEAKLNHEEYTNFVKWADRLGRKGELPLFADVFFETHVLNAMYSDKPGTQPSLLGPYFLEGSPLIESVPGQPCVLTQRPDEDGEVFYFKGNVKNTDGKPLANTKVEIWHNDNSAKYSGFDSDAPKYNLRGHLYTDDNGDFEVKTIVPLPYSIPTEGPTGEFLTYMDQHSMRPAHLHIMFEKEAHETLITQVFFEGDEWLDTDVAEGVRPDLMTKLEDHGDHKRASLDFIMRTDE